MLRGHMTSHCATSVGHSWKKVSNATRDQKVMLGMAPNAIRDQKVMPVMAPNAIRDEKVMPGMAPNASRNHGK